MTSKIYDGRVLVLALFLIFALVGHGMAVAQSGPTGTLSGAVKDPSGALMPAVDITLKNVGTGFTRTVATDAVGRWTLQALPVGTYEVSYVAPSFKKLVQSEVKVEAAVVRTIDAQMELQEAPGQTISVVGEVHLSTPDTAATSRQITSEELLQVPTSTRSFTHLLTAEAGISSDLPPVLGNSNGNVSPSVNGTRTTSTSLQFNGVDATNLTSNEGALTDNIAPAPETLQEVKLQTSLYDASTGRSGGGNFQLITKSGTNQFHGSAYWYVQNEMFNANDFFFNKEGIDKPQARRNEGGFSIGGPLVENKTFFFGGYQRTQARTAFVPTAQSRTMLPIALSSISGDRTAANIVAAFGNPANRCPAPAVTGCVVGAFPLTAAQISPVALAILNIKNPVTGDYLIPAPRADAELITNSLGQLQGDPTVSTFTGGLLYGRQRNVSPAEFKQDQFTAKLDQQFTMNNRLSGTFFFSNFPGFDPFPDPSSLASPVTLLRNDRARTLAIGDTHTLSPTAINEFRFGWFSLNNTRRLDDAFLPITSASVGITNPALFFDNSAGTQRLGHYVGRNFLSGFSFGGPNDSFNRREQKTLSLADNISMTRGEHTIRMGVEYKYHNFDTNLPEEQATEFEKFDNFTQFLAGFGSEADTQYGITDKQFRMKDLSWFIADDLRVSRSLTLNVGLRWDWFGWPTEKNGRIGNFDFAAMTNTENPTAAFIVPNNVTGTGFNAIDASVATAIKATNGHTLKGQDLNNFAPRIGFAWTPLDSGRLVIRGGSGIFYDRPSAAFMNTVFSNYPFLRELEITVPGNNVPLAGSWSKQDPTWPLSTWLPFRMVYQTGNTYAIRDGTPVTQFPNNANQPIDLSTGQVTRGNIAETFEFRAVDRNLRTPYIQQWNLGFQVEVSNNIMLEARYLGTKGKKLLQATAFNQSYDLNDPNTPDHIFKRFVDAYQAAYAFQGGGSALRGPLNSGATYRERGRGVAFGFPNLVTGNPVDYNLSGPGTVGNPGIADDYRNAPVIGFEARGPIMGFNIPEAVLLQSSANSIYHALQLNVTKRMSRGLQLNTSYTWSKSIDNNSADPGSTAGGGKPDVPNVGFVVQGDQRNLATNRSVSDFDRPHRVSASFVYALPSFGSSSPWMKGWMFSGFTQVQSGSPFSIISAEPEIATVAQYTDLARGSGGLFRHGFGRPSINGTLDQLRTKGSDPTEQFFDTSLLVSPLGGLGSLGRNSLRNNAQKRVDFALAKTFQLQETSSMELRWEVFNAFNNVNFATPGNDVQDPTDLGVITNTVGGPRVMQFGLRLEF